jgi:hypothetical protein
MSARSFLRRYRKLWIALGIPALLLFMGVAVLLYWAYARAVLYPEGFRELVERKYQAQLALVEKKAFTYLPLSEAEMQSLDLPEILDATVWREQPPKRDGLLTSYTKSGSPLVSRRQVRPRALWPSWLEQEAVMGRPALNLVLTAEGNFIEYEKKLAKEGDELVSYTVTFDPKLLGQP